MRAIFPWSVGVFALLVLGSVSDGYVLVSPVYRRTYLHAPDYHTGMYYNYDAWGKPIGPFYALRPPFPPVGNCLPGAVGHGIQIGYLPHTILMSKEGMDLGNVPLLADRDKKNKHKKGPPPTPPTPPNGMQAPYPVLGTPDMQRYGNVQQPYGGLPMSPYPMGITPGRPAQGMIPHALPLPGPTYPPTAMPPGPNPYGPPMYPSPQPPGQMSYHWPYRAEEYAYGYADSNGHIHQVQNATMAPNMYAMRPGMYTMAPNMYTMRPGMYPMTANMYAKWPMQPHRPGVPGSYMPMMPYYQSMHAMAPLYPMNRLYPIAPLYPMNRLYPMAPIAPMNPMTAFTPVMPTIPLMQPMQLPNMDALPPPPQQTQAGGSAYPVHPFTRSPRDFFMWAENLEDERARGTRQFPGP